MIRLSGPAVFPIVALALALVLNVMGLSVFPPPHCDEATYGSIAFELLRSGQFRSEMTGDLIGLNQYNSAVGRLWVLGMSLFIKLFGVKLLVVRLYSLLGGIVAVWLSYLVARELRVPGAGMLAALMVAFSWKMFYASHIARPEIWLVSSVLLALFWMVSRAQRMKQAWEAMIAGVICVMPLEFHPLGFFFVAGFMVAAGYYFWWVGGSWRLMAGFAAGVVFGVVLWIAAHFLPNPSLAWMQWTRGVSQMGLVASPSIAASLRNFGSWFAGQFITSNRFLGVFETCVYLIGAVYVVRRRSTRGMIIALVAGISLLAFALTNSQKSPQYAVVWVPLFLILSAQAFVAIGRELPARVGFLRNVHGNWAQILVFMPVLGMFLAGNLWLTVRYPRSGYERTLALMRRHVPAGATVLGDPVWWWGFAEDRNYIGDWYLAAKSQFGEGVFDVRAEFEQLGADYVILDNSVACTLAPSQVDKQLQSVVSEKCQSQASIRGAWLGQGTYESQFQFGQVSVIYACRDEI